MILSAGVIAQALAQTWPAHPFRVIVAYASCGTVYIITRFAGDHRGATLGHPTIIENRRNAGRNIGTQAVTHATTDGYTLLVDGPLTQGLNPYLYKNLNFNPLKDLVSIVLIGMPPNLLAVGPKLDIDLLAKLVELASKELGALAYSSSGHGTIEHEAGLLEKIL